MTKYIMRLDDACEKRDIEKWEKAERLLDKFGVCPLVGIIPNCEDPMMDKYPIDKDFWIKVDSWLKKGWTVAMHGYNHVYSTSSGGINPVQKRSEFAGEPLSVQKEKIRKGVAIMRSHGIDPKVFFAPSHTFDDNTLIALKEETNIRIISDTIAFDAYKSGDFTFVPQQSGRARKLPFKTVTFCYHPNTMEEKDFEKLEIFLRENNNRFTEFPNEQSDRGVNFADKVIKKVYFLKRRK